MGYETYFYGVFDLDRPLTPEHKAYLEAFSEKIRVKRDPKKLKGKPDPLREAVGLPLGPDGAFFTGGTGDFGQDTDDSALPGDSKMIPCSWCQWVPDEDGSAIRWDGNERFYYYIEWIEFLINHFLGPWGYKLNGAVDWSGDETDDRGTLSIQDNIVEAYLKEERAQEIEEGLDEVLRRFKKKLPLLMGINGAVDAKIKKLLNGAE